jgi:hypothetical protein
MCFLRLKYVSGLLSQGHSMKGLMKFNFDRPNFFGIRPFVTVCVQFPSTLYVSLSGLSGASFEATTAFGLPRYLPTKKLRKSPK